MGGLISRDRSGGVVVEEDEIEEDEAIDDKKLYTRLDASSNSCKHTWNQIKANHTDISSLIISYNIFDDGLFDWKNEGCYIGSNSNVKRLVLFGVGRGYDEEIRQQTHFLLLRSPNCLP